MKAWMIFLIIIIVSGVFGWYLDKTLNINSPPLYWAIGNLSGALGMVVLNTNK